MRLKFFMPWKEFKLKMNSAIVQGRATQEDRYKATLDLVFKGTGINLMSMDDIMRPARKTVLQGNERLILVGTLSGSDTEMVYEKLRLSDQFIIEVEA